MDTYPTNLTSQQTITKYYADTNDRKETFQYIRHQLNLVHANLIKIGIPDRRFLHHMAVSKLGKRLIDVAYKNRVPKSKLSVGDLVNAVEVVFTDNDGVLNELGKRAIIGGNKAINNKVCDVIPLNFIYQIIAFKYEVTETIVDNEKIGVVNMEENSSSFLSGILSYILDEILELAGNSAADSRKKTITKEFIFRSIGYDNELKQTFIEDILFYHDTYDYAQHYFFKKINNIQ